MDEASYVLGESRRDYLRINLLSPVVLSAKRKPSQFFAQELCDGERSVHRRTDRGKRGRACGAAVEERDTALHLWELIGVC